MSNSTLRSIRYVVFHKPGPQWEHGVDFREQDGVNEHVQHYLKLHKQGKLELGGPFLLQDSGGMMVATKEVSQQNSMLLLQMTLPYDPACSSMKSAHG
jgi:hypothetical protein